MVWFFCSDRLFFVQGFRAVVPNTGADCGISWLERFFHTKESMSMATGILRIQAFAARQSSPVEGVTVTITGDGFTVTRRTDAEGSAGDVTLTTPDCALSLDENNTTTRPYAVCDLTAFKEGWRTVRIQGVQVFPGQVTLAQPEMIPDTEENRDTPAEPIVIPAHALFAGGGGSGPEPTTNCDPKVLSRVIIPKNITVHLGRPAASAQNVTVSFRRYIANVASSEVYPTWPEQALRANIHCQISLALNRIYTEWYRSQGYPFQITSSPAYDQYYVHDAGIFDTVSVLVDELFDQYISRPNDFAPIYSEYCDGVIATCDGMTQWGTVSLARQGMDALEILRYYYGQNIELRTAEVVEVIPDSYPGELSEGSTGADVTALQTRLNRIAINYPAIPFIRQIDGVYGAGTENAVRAFQQSFGLPATGVTDENTWYRIIYIYTAVTRLAELTSEGERPVSDDYPGRNLTVGSRGIDVLRMQYYLRVISEADPNIPATMIDGVFDVDTRDAVYAFQRDYGLVPTGVIDEATWNKIVNAYYYVLANAEVSEPYPGEPLSRGSQGASVLFIQTALNAVSQHVPEIPSVADDGIFGPETERAVRAFQSYYGLTVDGIVGPETWRLLALEMGTSRDIDEPAKG